MPDPRNPTPPSIPSGLDPGEWEQYCFDKPVLHELIATAWFVLAGIRHHNKPRYCPQHAKDVVSEFWTRPISRLTLYPDTPAGCLPLIGRNWFILAKTPSGAIHARIFDINGTLIHDSPLPDSPGSLRLGQKLNRLWHRKRLRTSEKDKILDRVRALTGAPLPGAFHKVVANMDPAATPEQRRNYVFVSVKNYARSQVRRDRHEPGTSLDEVVGSDDEDDRGRCRHDFLEDERSAPAYSHIVQRESANYLQRAIEDLPLTARETVLETLEEMAAGQRRPAKSARERQRTHAALSDLAALLALHEHGETLAGRRFIALVCQFLVSNPLDQQFAVAHFCHWLGISRLASAKIDAEAVRRRFVHAARALQPALDHRRKEAVRLLPRAQRLAALLLLDYGGSSSPELAAQLKCGLGDLTRNVRSILADINLTFRILIKRSSPTGRAALRKQIDRTLHGRQKQIASEFLLRKQSAWSAAKSLGLDEEQGKELLYQCLLALSGRHS